MGTGISMANINQIKQYAEDKEYEKALALIRQQDLSKSYNSQFVRICGEVFLYTHNYEECRNTLLMAHKMAPEGNRIIYDMIQLYIETGELVLAEKYYEQYVFNTSEDDSGLCELNYMFARSRHASAEDLYKALSPLHTQDRSDMLAYEFMLIFQLMDDKTRFDEEYHYLFDNFRDSEYKDKAKHLIEYKCAASELFTYPQESTLKHDEKLDAAEAVLLEQDYYRMYPKEPEIVLMADDYDAQDNQSYMFKVTMDKWMQKRREKAEKRAAAKAERKNVKQGKDKQDEKAVADEHEKTDISDKPEQMNTVMADEQIENAQSKDTPGIEAYVETVPAEDEPETEVYAEEEQAEDEPETEAHTEEEQAEDEPETEAYAEEEQAEDEPEIEVYAEEEQAEDEPETEAYAEEEQAEDEPETEAYAEEEQAEDEPETEVYAEEEQAEDEPETEVYAEEEQAEDEPETETYAGEEQAEDEPEAEVYAVDGQLEDTAEKIEEQTADIQPEDVSESELYDVTYGDANQDDASFFGGMSTPNNMTEIIVEEDMVDALDGVPGQDNVNDDSQAYYMDQDSSDDIEAGNLYTETGNYAADVPDKHQQVFDEYDEMLKKEEARLEEQFEREARLLKEAQSLLASVESGVNHWNSQKVNNLFEAFEMDMKQMESSRLSSAREKSKEKMNDVLEGLEVKKTDASEIPKEAETIEISNAFETNVTAEKDSIFEDSFELLKTPRNEQVVTGKQMPYSPPEKEVFATEENDSFTGYKDTSEIADAQSDEMNQEDGIYKKNQTIASSKKKLHIGLREHTKSVLTLDAQKKAILQQLKERK